ncbi:MAG TPA: putative Ig domain-containing protein [Pseudomonadales bacterium]
MNTRPMPFRLALVCGLALLLAGCLPPAIFPVGILYAVTGDDVPISLTVSNNPSSVSCQGGAVVLAKVATDTWEGIVPAGLLSLGDNTLNCKASNKYGSISQTVGTIVVIDNVPPALVTFSSVTVYDNNGGTAINEPLVDTGASSNLDGASYALDASSAPLPAGLSIDSDSGNLTGTIDVASQQTVTDIYLQATTAAGSDVNDAPLTIIIEDGPSP